MRRKEREVNERKEIVAILDQCPVLRIALSTGSVPYIVPVNYAAVERDGQLVFYFHSGKEGRKMALVQTSPQVGFEVDRLVKIVENEVACHWGACYESVIGEGTAVLVTDEVEKKAGMDLIMQRYGHRGPLEYGIEAFKSMVLIRIDVTAISGKRYLPN